MGVERVIGAITAAIVLTACSPVPPLYFGPEPVWNFGAAARNAEAINSAAFAVRPPLPGQPGYLETIRYIDNGIKYIDPYSEFFIDFDGQMCFRGLVNKTQTEFEYYQNYWCMYPTAVSNVDALENSVSYVNEVRLWCRHAAPQCARQYGIPNFLEVGSPVANSISVETVPFKQERDAIDYLIYLMGGNLTESVALR
jgi:hypothetical protein